jgi:allantoin racemase
MLLPTSGYSQPEIQRRQDLIGSWLPVGFAIELIGSPKSPEFLDEAHHFDDAVAEAGALLSSLTPEEFAVVIEGGALDPGLDKARAASPVPVVGPGEASMYVASILNRPTSIITVDEHAVAAAERMLAILPMAPPISSIRSIETPVREVMKDFGRAEARILHSAERAIADDGAEAIFLGAMILGMLPASGTFRERLGVPVFNPVRIAVAAAVQLAQADS